MIGKRKGLAVGEATVAQPGSSGQFLRRLVSEDRGVTLTEMLVTLFLTSLLIGLLGMAFYQLFTATKWGNDTLTALRDLENAEVWLSQDARQAQSFTAGSSPVYGTFDGGDSTVQYSYNSGNMALVRTVDGDSTLTVARHIAQEDHVQFSVDGSLVTIAVTSTSGATSRNTTLKINMRVN
jgi:prepilin-type N-terminal cleavage/methylation domain-containing protein